MISDALQLVLAILIILLFGPVSIICAFMGIIPLHLVNEKWKDIQLGTWYWRALTGGIGFVVWAAILVTGYAMLWSSLPAWAQIPALRSSTPTIAATSTYVSSAPAGQSTSTTNYPGATETATTVPTLSDTDLIVQVVLNYYQNIPNDKIPDTKIHPDVAWSSLTPSLQNVFQGRAAWDQIIQLRRFVISSTPVDIAQSVKIDIPYAIADVNQEVIYNRSGVIAENPHEITLCLLRAAGTWLIQHINTIVIPLDECKNF